VAEFAYEPEPEVRLAPGESVREISGRSPWQIAGRRLVRNRIAMGALVLFLLIVVVSFLAPVYANRIANTDPFVSNI
jgi:peptide/nickel transport system permease protein